MQEQRSQPQPVDAISRRSLLSAAAVGALALTLPPAARAPASATGVRARGSVRPYSTPLPIPAVLTGADLTIPMREAEVSILPGRRTRMWTYGGSCAAATIRRPPAATTRVRFLHRLPRQAAS